MGVPNVQDTQGVSKPEGVLGVRHVVIFLMFLATTLAYAARVSMSIGIVAMTSPNEHGFQVFDWSRQTQDTILSSFFWGYIVLQIPAGMISGLFGNKTLIFVALLSNGVVNLLVPTAAQHGGWIAVCICRVVMGLTQGILYPSIHGLLGQWVPVTERSRMGTFVYSGAQLGTIIEMVTAGVLSASPWGWPSVYYTVGTGCTLWAAAWLALGASSPATSRWISPEERRYIEAYAGTSHNKKFPIPWKKIWTSVPFLSILFANCGQCLGFWTLMTEMPSYMNTVLGVDIKSNGFLSALPYVAMYILSNLFSWIADMLVNRKIFSITTVRKIFNTISFWGPAAALLVLSYLPAHQLTLSVVLLTITVGVNGGHFVGYLISHIDIAPNFASTLIGLTNGIGNIPSIMAPLSVSLVVKDETLASEWRKVFFISIAFYFFSNLIFILLMSGKIQDWNEPKPTDGVEFPLSPHEKAATRVTNNTTSTDKAEVEDKSC